MTVDLRAEAEAANAELYAAFEAADLDRMHALWDGADHPDDAAAVTCVHPGWDALHGRERVLRSWALIMANTSYIQFFLTDVRVSVVGSTAVVTCTENILTSVTDSGGDARVVSTNVFHRRGDAWRLTVHHGSPVLGDPAASEPSLGEEPQP